MGEDDAIQNAIDVVSAFFDVSIEDMASRRRSRSVHRARCFGIYLAYTAGADEQEIGRRFGRDQNMVLAICRAIRNEVLCDQEQARQLSDLMDACASASESRNWVNLPTT
jgi:chromosomal replication initiation ATPase DnaA